MKLFVHIDQEMASILLQNGFISIKDKYFVMVDAFMNFFSF